MNVTTWTPVFHDILRSNLPWCTPDVTVSPDMPLADLGLDSLKTVRLLIALENEYGLVFPDELLASNTFATAASLWTGLQSAAVRCGVDISG